MSDLTVRQVPVTPDLEVLGFSGADMTDEVRDGTPKAEAAAILVVLLLFAALAVGLPYYVLTGAMDDDFSRNGWWFGLVMLGGWLVALHTVVQCTISLRHRKTLSGDALKAKADDGATAFWWALIKWTFYIALAVGAWLVLTEVFLPASGTNKLLAVVAVLLIGVIVLLVRIAETLKARR